MWRTRWRAVGIECGGRDGSRAEGRCWAAAVVGSLPDLVEGSFAGEEVTRGGGKEAGGEHPAGDGMEELSVQVENHQTRK